MLFDMYKNLIDCWLFFLSSFVSLTFFVRDWNSGSYMYVICGGGCSSFGFVNAFHKYRVNMSTFVRNFLLAQWTTTVVCIAPGLKMAQMFKLWRLHKYVLYMYCPGQKKKITILVMHQVILKNLQSDFATMHRYMKSWQLQVGFAHDSAAESSTLIPRYHKVLILCISSMVLFFLSRVVDGRFCGRKFCQWSYLLPSTVQSLFSYYYLGTWAEK